MRTVIVAAALLLAGCTDTVTLRHAQTGATARCGGNYAMGLYAFSANDREARCIADFQRQGYERVSN